MGKPYEIDNERQIRVQAEALIEVPLLDTVPEPDHAYQKQKCDQPDQDPLGHAAFVGTQQAERAEQEQRIGRPEQIPERRLRRRIAQVEHGVDERPGQGERERTAHPAPDIEHSIASFSALLLPWRYLHALLLPPD